MVSGCVFWSSRLRVLKPFVYVFGQQCRLNDGLPLCTQDSPCLVCEDRLPEAWTAQAKATAQRNRRKAAATAKAARKETEIMDDSVELHTPRDAFPTKHTKSEDSSKAKRSKTVTISSQPKSVASSVTAVERPSSHGSDHRRSRTPERKPRHGEEKRHESPRHQSSRRDGHSSDRRERESGPNQLPLVGPALVDVPSPAVSRRRRTPVRRALPLAIISIILRAIVDPSHHLHQVSAQSPRETTRELRQDGWDVCRQTGSPAISCKVQGPWETHDHVGCLAGSTDSHWIGPSSSSSGPGSGRLGRCGPGSKRRLGHEWRPGSAQGLGHRQRPDHRSRLGHRQRPGHRGWLGYRQRPSHRGWLGNRGRLGHRWRPCHSGRPDHSCGSVRLPAIQDGPASSAEDRSITRSAGDTDRSTATGSIMVPRAVGPSPRRPGSLLFLKVIRQISRSHG